MTRAVPLLHSRIFTFVFFRLFQIAAKKYCNFDIPAQFTGVWRYLNNAYERDEFRQTCPADIEIEKAYFTVANQRK